MTSNISISTLTNKTLNDNSISVRNSLNANYVNTNSLFDNTDKTEKINSHSKLLMDNIINNNAQINKIKEQLYNKIYDICLNQISNNYKITDFIIFEVPKSYMNVNYNWIECIEYLIRNLKLSGYVINKKDNFIRIDWGKFNKKFKV